MTAQLVTIEKASPACLDDVLEILSQVNLPHDGVKERFGGFLIARSGGARFSAVSAWNVMESLGFFVPPPCFPSIKANGSAISSSGNSSNARRRKG